MTKVKFWFPERESCAGSGNPDLETMETDWNHVEFKGLNHRNMVIGSQHAIGSIRSSYFRNSDELSHISPILFLPTARTSFSFSTKKLKLDRDPIIWSDDIQSDICLLDFLGKFNLQIYFREALLVACVRHCTLWSQSWPWVLHIDIDYWHVTLPFCCYNCILK